VSFFLAKLITKKIALKKYEDEIWFVRRKLWIQILKK
jgi:hypothetical protein